MSSDFAKENPDLFWHLHDSFTNKDTGERDRGAPQYAHHMASTMFEPYVKSKSDTAFSLGGSHRMDTYKGSYHDLT
jgi:hypothetical protein